MINDDDPLDVNFIYWAVNAIKPCLFLDRKHPETIARNICCSAYKDRNFGHMSIQLFVTIYYLIAVRYFYISRMR